MKKYFALIMAAAVCFVVLCGCNDETPKIQPEIKNKATEAQETDGIPEAEAIETKAPDFEKEESETVSPNTVFEPEEAADTTPPGYVAPDGWYAPRFTTGKVVGGEYDLIPEVMGLKVYYVQKKLDLYPSTWGYYRDETIANVMWFQEENELIPTGDVDLATWKAMGFTEAEWSELGTYVTPVKIKREYDTEQIIDVFIDTALEYLGTPYVVGASGKPNEGVDCSGLVLQCLYAIGIYPDGLDPVQHSTIEEYNSRLMWADPKFKEIRYSDLQVGDLVFYRRSWSEMVCHVAIYIGGNECVEALNGDVELLPLQKEDDDYIVMGYKRVIAD